MFMATLIKKLYERYDGRIEIKHCFYKPSYEDDTRQIWVVSIDCGRIKHECNSLTELVEWVNFITESNITLKTLVVKERNNG